jgi:predicted GNAT family acetyltransferase
MPAPVEHDPATERFLIRDDAGDAYLQYGRLASGALDFRLVFVPESQRGAGVAARLVAHALAYARERRLEVVPSCSYVRDYLQREEPGPTEG